MKTHQRRIYSIRLCVLETQMTEKFYRDTGIRCILHYYVKIQLKINPTFKTQLLRENHWASCEQKQSKTDEQASRSNGVED